jgi:hypothetical protein
MVSNVSNNVSNVPNAERRAVCVCVRACVAYIREYYVQDFYVLKVSDSGFLRSGRLLRVKGVPIRDFYVRDNYVVPENWHYYEEHVLFVSNQIYN